MKTSWLPSPLFHWAQKASCIAGQSSVMRCQRRVIVQEELKPASHRKDWPHACVILDFRLPAAAHHPHEVNGNAKGEAVIGNETCKPPARVLAAPITAAASNLPQEVIGSACSCKTIAEQNTRTRNRCSLVTLSPHPANPLRSYCRAKG